MDSSPVRPSASARASRPPSETQQSWPVKEILDEWEDKFLIAWEGIDPESGKEWEPTWESKSNVSPDLRQAWNAALLLRPSQQQQQQPPSAQTPNSRPATQSHQSSPLGSVASSTVSTPDWHMTASSQDAAAARARRSSRAPSPSTLESLVPDSQAGQDTGPAEVENEQEEDAQEEDAGDDEEEPSTQDVSFEAVAGGPAVAVAEGAKAQRASSPVDTDRVEETKSSAQASAKAMMARSGPRCQTSRCVKDDPTRHPVLITSAPPIASTSRAIPPSPHQSQPVTHAGPAPHTHHPSPKRVFDRAAVSRAIAAAMPSAKPTAYSSPSPRPEDELVSSFDSHSSVGSSSGGGVQVRALPRARSLSRPVVTMGLAGPQILPMDRGDVLPDGTSYGYGQGELMDAEADPTSNASALGSQPAILVCDTPSASTALVSQPQATETSSIQSASMPAISSLPALLDGPHEAGGAPGAAPAAPSKREHPDEKDDEARKKVKQAATVEAEVSVPAPKLSPQTLGLIKLVRESTHVNDADQTKEEIIKFVSNPKAYASSLGAPLCRQPAWAFELRRATYDGVEKHDWILINSTEGTYFLKRTPSTQQVAFATSLDHIPARPSSRQGTAQPPTSAAAPSPAPPAEDTASVASAVQVAGLNREQLEAEFAKLAAGLAAATAELVTLRPLAAELATAQASVATLTRQNKALQSSKESISSDFNYMQAQYSEASSAALARAREAEVAEAEVAQLRTKLGLGMAQRDKIMEGIERKWRAEVRKMEGEVKLLREEKRRSEVPEWQEKAALWEAHLAREELRKEGAMELAEGDEPDEEERGTMAAAAAVVAGGDRPRLWTRPGAETQTQAGTELTLGSSQAGGMGSLEYGWACEWRGEGDEGCGEVLETKEALREHVVAAHVPV